MAIAQKMPDHTITIGSGGLLLPGVIDPLFKDGPYTSAGASFQSLGFQKAYYDRYQYGEFSYLDADHTPNFSGFLQGRVFALLREVTADPVKRWAVRYSQDVSGQTTGDYAFSMTVHGYRAVTGLPANWNANFTSADEEALYLYGKTTVPGTTWGRIRIPWDGGTMVYSPVFDETAAYSFSAVVSPFEKTSLAIRNDGIDQWTMLGLIGTTFQGPRDMTITRWSSGASNSTQEEFHLSDPDDDILLHQWMSYVFPSYMEAVGVYQNQYGWLVSVFGDDLSSTRHRAWFQISQDFTYYRKIEIVGNTEIINDYLDEIAAFLMYDDNGHIIVPQPGTSEGVWGSSTFDVPDFPVPTTGDVQIRAWTGTLDGHDFYVLRLGIQDTLVYDTYSKMWYDWESASQPIWSVNAGYNWIGSRGKGYESSIVVGDDTSGQLYFLDPTQEYDENNTDVPAYFERIAMAQTIMQGRKTAPCHVIYLNGDNDAVVARTVKLETSDDNGKTFFDHGSITAEPGNYEQEFSWRSLGLIRAPGRLFKITDDGAFTRVDNLEVNDNG